MPYLFLFVALTLASADALEARIVARVNGESISDVDVKNELTKELTSGNPDDALDRLILFRLAVQNARTQELDKNENVRKEIDKVLYKAYLDNELAKSPEALNVSESALKKYYENHPQLRLRHLVLMNETPAQQKATANAVTAIREGLAKGTDFKDLVVKYSQDGGARFAGDLDYRGPQNLPPEIYEVGLKLKKNEVSDPIGYGGAVHLVQLLDRQTYKKAPTGYLEHLRSRLKQERSDAMLMGALSELRRKAKIEKALPAPEDKK